MIHREMPSKTEKSTRLKKAVRRVSKVCDALQACYGQPRFGNPQGPIDDLIYIILSNKTLSKAAQNAFLDLKKKFRKWERLATADSKLVREIIAPAGLSVIKTKQIQRSLRKIIADFGKCSLDSLRGLPAEAVERYLVSLDGVSVKVAKCVMMYTMAYDVLPVDTHVHRVAVRLGWTIRKRADQCHDELEAIVPGPRRFAFHVNCIAHGRIVCTPRKPACAECCINKHCEYYRSKK